MTNWVVLVCVAVVGLALARLAWGQEPATQSVERAEIRLLRAQVESQRKTIEAQQAEIAELRAKLDSAGLSTEEARPAVGPDEAKRVVVAIGSTSPYSAETEIRAAIAELKPEQWFNVVSSGLQNSVAVPAFPTMQLATDTYREQAAGKFKSGGDTRASILGALRFRPEVILYIGAAPSDEVIAEVQQENRGINARIYTTTARAPEAYSLHRLWRLAHVTGGECIDKTGNAIEEPPLPIAIAAPAKPAATRPSPFKMR